MRCWKSTCVCAFQTATEQVDLIIYASNAVTQTCITGYCYATVIQNSKKIPNCILELQRSSDMSTKQGHLAKAAQSLRGP